MAQPTEALKAFAHELGFTTAGVCRAVPPPHLEAYAQWLDKGYAGGMRYLRRHLPMKGDPGSLLPGVRSIVAVSLNYNQPNPPRAGYPRIARYALGRDYHRVLRGKLKRLGRWIRDRYPGATCRPCVDSAPILERDYAQLAGLGWFGKNTMLIDSRRGSWFFIGLLLTTVDFEADAPAEGSCGTCRQCVEACPTGAIVFEDGRWQVDARRCISYLTIEHRGDFTAEQEAMVGEWTFGCDVCQEVCPFNEPRPSQPLRGVETGCQDFLDRRVWPKLEELPQIGPDQWDNLSQGSAIRRAGREGIVRNARANLNVARTQIG